MIVIGPCGRHLQDFSPCEREGDGGASNRVGGRGGGSDGVFTQDFQKSKEISSSTEQLYHGEPGEVLHTDNYRSSLYS